MSTSTSMKGDEDDEGDEGSAPPPPSTVSLYSFGICSFVRSFEDAPGRGEGREGGGGKGVAEKGNSSSQSGWIEDIWIVERILFVNVQTADL